MGANLIGFDIGDGAVKIVRTSGGVVKKAVYAEVLDNMVNQGNIVSMDAIADFIKEKAKEGGITGGQAAVILPERVVVTRNVTIPVMSESQLKYNLPFEFRDYLDEEKNRYFYDYAVKEIIKDENGKPNEMRLLACAVSKASIDEYRRMFKRAGFKLKTAVPAVYAFEKYVQSFPQFSPEGYYCLVNVGHVSTMIYFLHGGEVISSRILDYGVYNLETAYAEKEEVDIHIAHTNVASDYKGVLGSEMAEAFYNNLAVEVMKAVNFFNYNNREANLAEMCVFGGGSMMPKLLDTMSAVTGLPVRKAGDVTGSALQNIEAPELYVQALAATL